LKPRKRFITPEQLYKDAYQLAHMVHTSGYEPDVILVMWRGGSPVGIVVHEYLAYHGIETWHSVVKAQSYTGIASRKTPALENISSILKQMPKKAKVLIVDDIYDTGSTMKAMRQHLIKKVESLKIAAIYYKSPSTTAIAPDFYVRKTRSWIVFPHELIGLSASDIRRKGAHINRLLTGRKGRT
jgi:hypoxanthine phosphoribosyltransferase